MHQNCAVKFPATEDFLLNLRLSLAQLNLLVGDIAGNADRVIQAACHARDEQHADAVIFPELTLTGYPPEDLLLRPELMQRVEAALTQISAATAGIDLILGYPRRQEGRLFNTWSTESLSK